MIEILDCTLRDGSYVNSGNFGSEALSGIIGDLTEAGIDIIESGWLSRQIGMTYFGAIRDVNEYLPAKRGRYSVMVNGGSYELSELEENDGKGVDIIRYVVKLGGYSRAMEDMRIMNDKGYSVYLQAYNTIDYDDIALGQLAEVASKYNAEGVYIVNTNGSMYLEDLGRIYNILDKELDNDIKIGLHTHNNMQLAFGLALEFIRISGGRNIVIDSSLSGMGRGAGNLCTEIISGYLGGYNDELIMGAIDKYIGKISWGYSIRNYLAGRYGVHIDNVTYLAKKYNPSNIDLMRFLKQNGGLEYRCEEELSRLWKKH